MPITQEDYSELRSNEMAGDMSLKYKKYNFAWNYYQLSNASWQKLKKLGDIFLGEEEWVSALRCYKLAEKRGMLLNPQEKSCIREIIKQAKARNEILINDHYQESYVLRALQDEVINPLKEARAASVLEILGNDWHNRRRHFSNVVLEFYKASLELEDRRNNIARQAVNLWNMGMQSLKESNEYVNCMNLAIIMWQKLRDEKSLKRAGDDLLTMSIETEKKILANKALELYRASAVLEYKKKEK